MNSAHFSLRTLAAATAVAAAGLTFASAHEFGTKTWDFTYDSGAGSDVGDSIRLDSQGRIAVAGYIPTASRAQDALVFQITPAPGSTAVNWERTRYVTNTARNDRFYSLAIDSTDSIICTGQFTRSSAPYSQPLTEKFLPDGTSDWQDIWNPSAVGGTEAFSNGLAINADDEVFTSTYYDISAHNYILWGVRKYVTTAPGTYTGTLETSYSYDNGAATGGYSYSNRIEGLALDDEGGLCTVGRIGDGANQTRIWHVRRYGADTALEWSHTVPAGGNGLNGFARRVEIDAEGNPVVAGAVVETPGAWTARVMKYDNDTGLPAWTIKKPSPTPKNSFYLSVFIDRMGYYWAAGYTTDADDSLNGHLVRLDPDDGAILNEITWDGPYPRAFDIRDRRLAICLQDSGNIVVEHYTPDPPEITLAGDPVIELEVHSDYTEPGFSAYDEFEREDLTSSVVVTGLPDVHTVGNYTVRYNVDAYNGEPAMEKTRTVNIVDTTAPEIALLGGGDIRVDAGVLYHEPGFDVTDNYDPDLAGSVVVDGTVDTATPGTYQLQYRVSDTNGNPSAVVNRTVRVVRLEIDTVEITAGNEVRITCETERGASYRILATASMESPWTELEVVTTPDGQLDWSAPVTGAWQFLKVQRVSDL